MIAYDDIRLLWPNKRIDAVLEQTNKNKNYADPAPHSRWRLTFEIERHAPLIDALKKWTPRTLGIQPNGKKVKLFPSKMAQGTSILGSPFNTRRRKLATLENAGLSKVNAFYAPCSQSHQMVETPRKAKNKSRKKPKKATVLRKQGVAHEKEKKKMQIKKRKCLRKDDVAFNKCFLKVLCSWRQCPHACLQWWASSLVQAMLTTQCRNKIKRVRIENRNAPRRTACKGWLENDDVATFSSFRKCASTSGMLNLRRAFAA